MVSRVNNKAVLFVPASLLFLVIALVTGGCAPPPEPTADDGNGAVNGGARQAAGDGPRRGATARGSLRVQGVNLNDLVSPAAFDEPIAVTSAKNEWTSFTVKVTGLPPASGKRVHQLRLGALNHKDFNETVGAENFRAYQILSLPIDVNRAGYVRHTGLPASSRVLPRALLPMPVNDGKINLSAARDPRNPTGAQSRAGGSDPVMLWIDVRVPPEAKAGDYEARLDILESGNNRAVASVPVDMTVYDFVLPDERHLNLVGQVDWESLQRLFPDRFEAITDRLLNRNDDKYADAVRTLDGLMMLAQEHRTQLVIPRLQPTVKWPGGRQPQVTWDDYDTVVTPWLTGEMFPDKIPVGYWPLPAVNGLANYDLKSQSDYWAEAASHFDQRDWLRFSSVFVEKQTPGRANTGESLSFSADAAAILASHPRIRVCVPLEDDQVQFASEQNPRLIDSAASSRLITANPGIVFTSPIQNWPANVARPPRWLRTDLTGLIPYVGAGGDERDVRLWAWLASIPLPPPELGIEYGPVQFIRWVGVLPRTSDPLEPADPNELVWFYPGSWFGVDEPVPTIQLKWLRQAQQDFEYLYLAKQRGDRLNSIYMARLISKPVELQPGQEPDPTYGMMSGTANPKAWTDAKDLVAQRILLREPGQPVDKDREHELNLQMLRWSRPQERPVIMGRMTKWSLDAQANASIHLHLGIDIYNASDARPAENTLEWTAPFPSGWQVQPQPMKIDALATYQVRRAMMTAQVDPARVRNLDRTPIQITFTDGFSRNTSTVKMSLPVAVSERREGRLNIDGSLEDWSPDDLIQNGPLLRMFNRPALQAQQLQNAGGASSVYTGYADENFYVAFKVTGLSSGEAKVVRNFVNYQFRRGWGEDLCQILIQPVYEDNTTGPVMHVVCKPNGHWVERKMDPKLFADPWQAFEGTGVRYAATLDGPDWRGEVAIPWKSVTDAGKGRPRLLRFNFTQHRADSGESASWAGPVDFGRDDAFMGVLFLREQENPGVAKY